MAKFCPIWSPCSETEGLKLHEFHFCHTNCLYDITQPRVDLIKLFWRKFTYSFCKLDLFIEIQQIQLIFIKWSLQKVSKFMPKKFYEIDPWVRIHNT
jgi:hypothetical protein